MNQALPLDPEQMRPAWSRNHDQAAAQEGWGLFDCDDSENGRWQVCRIDDSTEPSHTQLANDDEAWKIVATGTKDHHVAARHFLKAHNPKEYHAIMTPRVGDRVFLESYAAYSEKDQKPIPAGWYILHRVCNTSGVIDSPDTLVTLCRENNAPGDYIGAKASQIHRLQPWFKCRLVDAEIWTDDDEDVGFTSLFEAIQAAEDFLVTAKSDGLDYQGSDIEIVSEDEVINFVEARKKVFPERLHYVFFIRDYQDKVIGHEVLPSSVGWRYKTVEPFPRADNGVVYPVKEKTEVRLLGVQHVGVFDIDGRKRIELRSSEGDEAFESACRFADRLGKPWKVSGSSELFDPETQRCWSHKTSWTATVHSTAINPNKLQTAEAPSQGKTEEGNAFPVLFQVDPQSKEATGTVMPFCSPACREAAGMNHGLGETRQGESTSSDFGYTVHCEQCGKEVGSQAGDGQNPGIAKAQREALAKLKLALQECTETGLFDVMTVDVHPDLINAFCDEAGRFELNGKAT